MRKYVVVAASLVVILLAASACGATSTDREASAVTYEVTRDTGLYSALSVDADQITVLGAGTKVEPADGESLDCDSITESGITLTVCHVKVVSTGQIGWILKKTIERN